MHARAEDFESRAGNEGIVHREKDRVPGSRDPIKDGQPDAIDRPAGGGEEPMKGRVMPLDSPGPEHAEDGPSRSDQPPGDQAQKILKRGVGHFPRQRLAAAAETSSTSALVAISAGCAAATTVAAPLPPPLAPP